ncbi:MAG: alkane 1-monooxygenase [Cyclobacteriaceae bacterium]
MSKKIVALKYALVFTLPFTAYIAFINEGWLAWLHLLYAFGFIPLAELFFNPNRENLSKAKTEIAKEDFVYDLILYLVVPIQFLLLAFFLYVIGQTPVGSSVWFGRVVSMGLLCGVMGINVAHELGHRCTWYERFMAKTLLLSSLYMHFYIEHNRGHHKNVATEQDPATARYGESIYIFWLRSVWYSYVSAWKIESLRLTQKGFRFFSWQNEMLRMQCIQLTFLLGIYLFFGFFVFISFLIAAILGFLLLEAVNYIEHYGLMRNMSANRYERTLPCHSWNSNHLIGRLMLFELSRHSDHHYIASRKYQILRHHEMSPQMPTGYPGMMLLALVPPLWFYVMHKEIRDFSRATTA